MMNCGGNKRNRAGKKRNSSTTEEARYKWFGNRLRQIMKIQNVTAKDLARKAYVSERSIRDYLAGRTYPKDSTLAHIAQALGINVLDLEDSETFTGQMFGLAVAFDKFTFEQTWKELTQVDEYLLKFIRSCRLTDQNFLKDGYTDLLRSAITRKGLSIFGFLNRINQAEFARRLLNTLPTTARLQIFVGDNFEHVNFGRDGNVILPIPHAKLLWDCCCTSRTEPNQECRIHSHPMGATVTDLFQNSLVEIKWRNMTFLWRQSRVLWPPSVDSFFMMQCLENAGLTNANVRTVLDVGSGTGFLGIALAKLNRNINKVVLSDWLLTPALFGQLNWRINAPENSATCVLSRVTVHTDIPDASEGPFDLVVCNPPYLPCLPGFEETGLESTVFGTDLLEHVIRMARLLGRQVFVQYSHLASPEAARAAKAAGVKLKVIGIKKNVPFRVRHALDRPRYVESLVSERKLRHLGGEGHHYFHDLTTCQVV